MVTHLFIVEDDCWIGIIAKHPAEVAQREYTYRNISIVTLTTNLWIQSRTHAFQSAHNSRNFPQFRFFTLHRLLNGKQQTIYRSPCVCRVTKTFCNDYKSSGPNSMPHFHENWEEKGIVAKRFQATTIYWKQLKFLIKKYQNINLVAPISLALSLSAFCRFKFLHCEWVLLPQSWRRYENSVWESCEKRKRTKTESNGKQYLCSVCTVLHTAHCFVLTFAKHTHTHSRPERKQVFPRIHDYVTEIVC